MSKKQKAAGKAGKKNGGKKSAGAAASKAGSGKKSMPGKSTAKSIKSGKAIKKVAKKLVQKVVKTAIKKVSGKKDKAKSATKGIAKKLGGAVKKLISNKKDSGVKKNLKSTSAVSAAKGGNGKATQKPVVNGKAVNKSNSGSASKQDKPVLAAASISKGNVHSGNGVDKKKSEQAPVKAATTSDKGRKLSDLFTKKPIERKPDDVLAITNTIPVKSKNEISPSKIASISYSITNPVRKTDSYAVKAEKEPAGKFEMEFVVHASAEMLYEFLSTPSGLSEWFCDDLNIRNGIYTFIWDDQLQQARLLKTIDQQLVRFQWVDKTDGSYFEFRIQRDDLTNDISLIITDFADTASERESSKLLWNSQVEKLMHVIGSIF